MEASTALYVVAAAMILIGVLVVIFDRKKRCRCTEETTATIVDVNSDFSRDEDGHKDYSYTPVFEFTARGMTVRRQGGTSSSRKRKFKVGEMRQVRYDPANPNVFYVVGDGGNSAGGIWLIILGVIIVGLSIAAQLGAFNGIKLG